MAIQTFDANMDIISALSDTPNETLSASALKAKFDEGGGLIKTYINGTLVPAINGILTTLLGKQDTLTFDEVPTSGSNNPVKSKGILSKLNEKAPTSHAVNANTYGVGTDGVYGHLKLLASVSSTLGVNDGTAATPSAVREAYNKADAALPKNGSGTMSGALAMGGYKVTNLGTPTSDTDAATKAYAETKVSEHASAKGSVSAYGHVKLSDSTSSTSGTSGETAATPKAVNDVRVLANEKYTKPSGGIPASDIASGVIPSAYESNPAMNGNASAGTSGSWAKGNHVHPTDNTRQAKITANGVLQGNGSGTITARAVETSAASSGSSSLITSGAVYSGLSGKLNLSGGTMTGDLTLKGDPTSALHSATKQYVDGHYVTAGQESGTSLGTRATAEGIHTTASASQSHAEGYGSKATNSSSHAEGDTTTASGLISHAEGDRTTASGKASHAEGHSAVASGNYSHAEGSYTTASGDHSHAEGNTTNATNLCAHAEGYMCGAHGYYSHAEGQSTSAQRRSQHVFGEYNEPDTSGADKSVRGKYVEIVGKGTSLGDRSNARTLDWSGNEVLAGKLTVGAAPTANMDVATKKYVDDAIAAALASLS